MQENKKVIRAWTFYDWANSAYSLIITSAIFPIYYNAIADPQISIFGKMIDRNAVASYSIALSFLIIAILSPLLSGMADAFGRKKLFLKFFCYIGSISCMAMFFFSKQFFVNNAVYIGLLFSMIASIGYCGSIVFYNAYLPEIANKENQDKISARGFTMGYIGSVLLMIVCLGLITYDEKVHLFADGTLLPRLSFVAVGLWWLLFAQIPFKHLVDVEKKQLNYKLNNGYKQLQLVWKELRNHPLLKKYLLAFFFYNMGVQTVMYMATYFAADELKMKTTELITTVLIIQLVAIAGAFLFSFISEKIGNIKALMILVIIWIGICISAYNTQTVYQFYILAFAVGLVMGGIQSMSRSTYSKMLPVTENTASYFSFYDVCDKVGIVIGTLSFGLVADLMGGMRNSTLALCIYFIIGFVLLIVTLKSSKNNIQTKY
jgi:UMF1 family MFS transporter